MGLEAIDLRMAAIRTIILVCSFIVHEWGHAIVADRLGDDTPRRQGRVTLNPMVHIDPLGSIFLPLLGALGMMGGFLIGWAKPVYTNPSNFRRGYFDQGLVTIAGPAMNVVLALVGTIGMAMAVRFDLPVVELFAEVIRINAMLIVFNMLPIPPLDGSKFLLYTRIMSEEVYARFSMWGGFLLIGLILLPPTRALLGTLIGIVLVPFGLLARLLS